MLLEMTFHHSFSLIEFMTGVSPVWVSVNDLWKPQ